MDDSKDESRELDASEVLRGGSPGQTEEVSGIHEEISRRGLVLDQLRAERDDLQREFKKLSPRTLVLNGDIGKLQMLDIYRKMIRQKLQKQLRRIHEAELDLSRAEEHLDSIDAEYDAGIDKSLKEE